jgi:hypothetical protein
MADIICSVCENEMADEEVVYIVDGLFVCEPCMAKQLDEESERYVAEGEALADERRRNEEPR